MEGLHTMKSQTNTKSHKRSFNSYLFLVSLALTYSYQQMKNKLTIASCKQAFNQKHSTGSLINLKKRSNDLGKNQIGQCLSGSTLGYPT